MEFKVGNRIKLVDDPKSRYYRNIVDESIKEMISKYEYAIITKIHGNSGTVEWYDKVHKLIGKDWEVHLIKYNDYICEVEHYEPYNMRDIISNLEKMERKYEKR